MSPKATEGGAARRAPTSSVGEGASRQDVPTPSGLPAISPSRGEIKLSYCADGCSASPSSVKGEALGTHCTDQPVGVGCF